MQNRKNDRKLNLNEKNIPPGSVPDPEDKPMTQEEAARQVAKMYNTLTNCMINIAIALDKVAFNTEGLLVELSDIKDNMNRKGLKEEWLTEIEIAEREKDDEPEEPASPGQ